MNVKVENIPNSQLKLNIKVDNKNVKEMYDVVLKKAVETTEVDGFRKGKAPAEKVEAKLGQSKLYGDVINELLQKYYSQALKENHIHPISNPKVEIEEFDVNKDFEFTATVAVKPDVKLGDYKKALKKYYEDKNKQVKKQNAEKLKKGEKIDHEHAHIHPNEIIEVVSEQAKTEVPDILVEEETNRLVARMVEQIIAAGMKTEDYLKAQNVTMEQIRENYDKVSEKNIKAELVLNELIKAEDVKITEEEIDKSISEVESEEARKQLDTPVQRIYIRSVLEKNKVVDNLIKEIEGEHHHEK